MTFETVVVLTPVSSAISLMVINGFSLHVVPDFGTATVILRETAAERKMETEKETERMKKQWWNGLTAYQIYPKSFNDTTGSGIGDINGVTEKLDYLKNLGVDLIWLSPCYVSPLADEGYDLADYYRIDPRFGTNEDLWKLIA